MSQKFVVEGGLSIPTGKKLELQGTELDASATELNYLSTFGITGIADEDNMVSDSATKLASQQSIKKYVDDQLGSSVLTFQTDTAVDNEVDLDDDTLKILGGDGMNVTHAGDTITVTAETASATNPGVVELATSAETNTGTDDERAVTPAGLTAWTGDTALVTLGTITTGTWQGTAITGTYIAADAVDGSKIADDSIDSEHYAAGSIDNEHIADDAIDSEHYAAGSIDNEHIADGAIDNAALAADAAVDLDKLDWTSASGTAIEDFAQDDYVMVYDTSATAVVEMTMDSLEDSIFGNVSGDILIAAGGAATIQANSVALATDTTGDYVAGVTAGTGLTSTGATSGENISHSLSVDASQAQITTLAGAVDIGTSGVDTAFAGEVTIDETLEVTGITTLTGGATIPTGKDLTLTDQPSADTDAANKAYVDAQLTASDLDFTSDGGESLSIDLDSEVLDIAGGSNLTTSAALNTITVALDSTVSGLTSMSATTVTDGTASLNAGSLSSLVNIDGSGDLTMGTITNAEFTVDANGNTDIDGTLNVEGVPTFQAQSVHSSGIQSGGNIVSDTDSTDDLGTSAKRWANLHVDAISGGSDEMIISADGDEDSVSGSANNSLSLNASGGIFTDDAVDMDSTLNVEGVATFQAESVHSSGIDCNGAIDVSGASVLNGAVTLGDATGDDLTFNGRSASDLNPKTDSSYDLGSSSLRWAEVHQDASVMEYAKKSSFTKTMTGAADVAFTFDTANYKAVKILCRMADGTDFTAKEVLVASDTDSGSLVEYGTVSTSTERACDFSVTYAAGTCSVKCTGTADDVLKGTYELIA